MHDTGPPQGAIAPLGGQGNLNAEQDVRPVVPRAKVARRPVHGVLLLDKPLGLSSNQALQKVKWLFRAEKAGHTGTLDPLATGVLPLCFGAATKFSQQHLDADKAYSATLALGTATATGDREGAVVETKPVPPLDADLLAQLAKALNGPQLQLPPMYSALKKDGKALYEYARAGEEVERTPRAIQIYELNLALSLSGKESIAIHLDALCSKGTYIRTLGEDVAKALGTVGHLTTLRRTRTGPFDQTRCVSIEALEAMDEAQRLGCLLPPTVLLGDHTPVVLSESDAARFLSGMRRRVHLPDADLVSVFGPPLKPGAPPCLLGTGHIRSTKLIPDRLLNAPEIAQIAQQAEAAQTH